MEKLVAWVTIAAMISSVCTFGLILWYAIQDHFGKQSGGTWKKTGDVWSKTEDDGTTQGN